MLLISNLFCQQPKTLEIKRLPPTDQKQLLNLSILAREWVCDFPNNTSQLSWWRTRYCGTKPHGQASTVTLASYHLLTIRFSIF